MSEPKKKPHNKKLSDEERKHFQSTSPEVRALYMYQQKKKEESQKKKREKRKRRQGIPQTPDQVVRMESQSFSV